MGQIGTALRGADHLQVGIRHELVVYLLNEVETVLEGRALSGGLGVRGSFEFGELSFQGFRVGRMD